MTASHLLLVTLRERQGTAGGPEVILAEATSDKAAVDWDHSQSENAETRGITKRRDLWVLSIAIYVCTYTHTQTHTRVWIVFYHSLTAFARVQGKFYPHGENPGKSKRHSCVQELFPLKDILQLSEMEKLIHLPLLLY